MTTVSRLTDGQIRSWSERGFFRIRGFAPAETCNAMQARVIDLIRNRVEASEVGAKVLPENNKAGGVVANPEDAVSKVFGLHRDGVFSSFALSEPVVELVAQLITPDIDVFLSQFIFKTSGAWGQPWHQDSFYFPFEPPRPVGGVWLAVTEATLGNGCLHVLPGSQVEPVHTHVPDRRPGANHGYFEIVDHDMARAEPVLMDPGDLLVFDNLAVAHGREGTRCPGELHQRVYGHRSLSPSAQRVLRDRFLAIFGAAPLRAAVLTP